MIFDFLRSPQTVEQECAALLEVLEHIVLSQVCLIVTGNKVSVIYKVG